MRLLFFIFITTKKTKRQEGYVLVYALAFGLFVLGIGLAMVLRAQNEAMVTTAQIEEKKAESALDLGLNRMQSFVNENRPLMKLGSETWNPTVTGNSPENLYKQKLLRLCEPEEKWQDHKQLIAALSSGALVPLDNTDSQLALKGYQFNEQKNTVTALIMIQGKEGAASQLKVEFEVNTPPPQIPALWLYNHSDSQGTGNVFLEGNVWSNNCQFPLNKVRFVTNDYHATYAGQDFPQLPPLDAIAPRIPPSQQLFRVEDSAPDLSFPRPTDVPTLQAPDGAENIPVYEYIVRRNIRLSLKELKINTFYNGKRVKIIFYLLGSIQAGTPIKHLCGTKPDCNPEDLIILGYGGNQKMDLGESDIPGPEVCIVGSQKFQGFIVASGYRFGLKRVNFNDTNLIFSGAALVNSFDTNGNCGENDQRITIKAAINNAKLPEDLQIENFYPQIGNLISYQEMSLEFSLNSVDPETESNIFGIQTLPTSGSNSSSFRLAPPPP